MEDAWDDNIVGADWVSAGGGLSLEGSVLRTGEWEEELDG